MAARLVALLAGFVLVTLAFHVAVAGPTAAPGDDSLILVLPPEWELGHQAEVGRVRLTEWVTKPQTVHNWTRLVTIQAIKGSLPPLDYARSTAARFKEKCPKTETYRDPQPDIDGRPAVRFFLRVPECPGMAAESDLLLAIQGQDQLWVVLYAWRPVPPTRQEFEHANALLGSVQMCPRPNADCTKAEHLGGAGKADHTSQKTLWERSMAAAEAAFTANRLDEAERRYQDALVEASRIDPDHETVVTTYGALAKLYRAQRREELAAETDRRASLIRTKQSQPGRTSHPSR